MMSSTPDSNHVQARKPIVNNTQTSSGNRKTAAAGSSSSSPKPPDNQQVLKCPRCDSPNTKFCYYNNYSLTQPRHFCKTCRRYWTKGGALRNVPIGGGCRKSKKNKSSTSGLSFSSSSSIKQDYSFDTDGFKLFHGGFSPSFDQFDQFGRIPFSRLTSSISTNGLFNNNHHQLVSFGDLSSNSTPTANTPPSVNPCFNMEAAASVSSGSSLMGFNHLGVGSSSSVFKQGDDQINTTTELFHGGGGGGGLVHHSHHQDMSSMNANHHHNSSNLASTMESLSSINQELHWKLQQERLAMLFGGGDTTTHNNNIHHHHQNKEISSTSVSSISGDLVLDHQNQQSQKPLPISFQNLEISKQELQQVGGGGNPSKKGSDNHGNEWLFDQNTYNSSVPTTTTTNNSSSWKGIQAWSDHLHNYM